MMKTVVIGICMALVTLASGCVSKARYQAQVRTAQKHRSAAEQCQAGYEACQARYDRLKALYAGRLKFSQKELEALARARKQAEERLQIYQRLTKRFQKLIDAGTLSIQIVHGRMVLRLRSAVLFDSGKDVLKPHGKEVLTELGEELAKIDGRHFQVTGHTDNVPVRKLPRFTSNWDLSAGRAVRVVNFLIERGVKPGLLSAGGFSEHQPVADNATEDGRQSNRRIEITLMPFIPVTLLRSNTHGPAQ